MAMLVSVGKVSTPARCLLSGPTPTHRHTHIIAICPTGEIKRGVIYCNMCLKIINEMLNIYIERTM